MKRILGISLLLLILVLSGCGGGSSSSTANRFTVTGTICKDNSGNPLTSSDFAGGYMTVRALTAGAKGLGELADVDEARVSDSGTFSLRYIPTDRRTILKIEYHKDGSVAFYGWYLFDAIKDQRTIRILPREIAAHRLAFDLVRSFVDHRLRSDVFGDSYTAIEQSIEPHLSSTLSAWMADPVSFYSTIRSQITTPNAYQAYLKPIINSTVDHVDLEDGDDKTVLVELGDDDLSDYKTLYDHYLVANDNTLNITYLSVKLDNTAGNMVVAAHTARRNLNLDLVVYNSDLNDLGSTGRLVKAMNGETVTVTFDELPGGSINKSYYLQVVAVDAVDWYSSNSYATVIDYDRTPGVIVKRP